MVNSTLDMQPSRGPSGGQSISSCTLNMLFGLLGMLLNGSISITVYRLKGLRKQKELIILSLLTTADCLNGFAFFCWGFIVLYGSMTLDPVVLKTTPLQCMYAVIPTTYALGSRWMSMALLVLSVDRLICVVNVHFYMSLGKRYLAVAASGPLSIVAVLYIVEWWISATIPQKANKGGSVVCLQPDPTGGPYSPFYVFSEGWNTSVACLSCVIYLFIIFKFVFETKSASSSIHSKQLEKQHKVTKICSLLAMTALLTYVVPMAIKVGVSHIKIPYDWLNLIIATYSVWNAAVYLSRPTEVRGIMIASLRKMVLKICAGCGRKKKNVVLPLKLMTSNQHQRHQDQHQQHGIVNGSSSVCAQQPLAIKNTETVVCSRI